MASNREETGRERQERIQREQHRPEQNEGYDEVVDGVPPVRLDITDTVANGEQETRSERIDDQAAGDAANDVRRREHSAD